MESWKIGKMENWKFTTIYWWLSLSKPLPTYDLKLTTYNLRLTTYN